MKTIVKYFPDVQVEIHQSRGKVDWITFTENELEVTIFTMKGIENTGDCRKYK